MTRRVFNLGKHSLSLTQPHIMGIVNVTPDSFYDGGRWVQRDAALRHAERLAAEGAGILDIGGESTRPGATPITPEEEIERVLWLVEELCSGLDLPISVDTSCPELMDLAAAAGASMINDVRALRRPGALAVAAKSGLPVCLMHMRGSPGTMQQAPHYANPIQEIMNFLRQRIEVCTRAGINPQRLLVDPGFGFGKTHENNCELFAQLRAFHQLGCPLLVGLSRKSFLGTLTARDIEDRLSASIAACALAWAQGVWIVRVHDVAASVDALKVTQELLNRNKHGKTMKPTRSATNFI